MKRLFAAALLLSSAALCQVPCPHTAVPAILTTTSGDVTISAEWLWQDVVLPGQTASSCFDQSSMQISVGTLNPSTDAFRISFTAQHGPSSNQVVMIIVREKRISYPSGNIYPFPSVGSAALNSACVISNVTIEELAFIPVAASVNLPPVGRRARR